MIKFTFKDVSTKNSKPTYWTILFVMPKMYFIYKVAGKKCRRVIKNWTMSKNNACAVEIKIKWIPRKQMTHENTYRDDNFVLYKTDTIRLLLVRRKEEIYFCFRNHEQIQYHLFVEELFDDLSINYKFLETSLRPKPSRLPLRNLLFLSCNYHGVTDRICKQKSRLKCACFLYKIHVTLQCIVVSALKKHQK
jgi:hypothetical protein